jgi:predicted nucleotidyltransferase
MTRTLLDLSGKLRPYEDVFREIIRITSEQGINFFVVGALARDIIMGLGYGVEVKRATEDIDCGIQAESWKQFEHLKSGLIDTGMFRADVRQRQRVIYQNQIRVDIVPFGAIEDDKGRIAWPPDREFVMNTLGFDEAYRDTITVRLAADIEISVSSLAGLALMKLIAWSDRRHAYHKDALDLGFLMSNCLDAGNQERIYGEEGDNTDLLSEDFDYDLASARMLGRDVGRLLTERSYAAVTAILDAQTGEQNEYPLVEAMIRNGENFHGDFDKALRMLETFKHGVLDSRHL